MKKITLFSCQVKKMSLSHIAKNRPKTQLRLNFVFSYFTGKAKVTFFFTKNDFLITGWVKKMSNLAWIDFLAFLTWLKWTLNLCDTEPPRLIPRIRLRTANRQPVSQWKVVKKEKEFGSPANNFSLGNGLAIHGS